METNSQAVLIETRHSPHAALRPVPMTAVTLRDDFWQPRRDINRFVTLESQYKQCEETGRIENFRRVADGCKGDFQGAIFNDSDVYKWLEGVAWSLSENGDNNENLRVLSEKVGQAIAAMQRDDGYLHSYFACENAHLRWTNLGDWHELYCMGHFIQAAVVHHRATLSTQLLDVARRAADCIIVSFGSGEGQMDSSDGHEEIEMALVELYRETGEEKYLRGAQYFVNVRGEQKIKGSHRAHEPHYIQDHVPLRDMTEIVGHAVRAVYFNIGATDLYAETGDEKLRAALQRLWRNMTQQKMYISGGIGARHDGEAFGDDYELPNSTAYAETCAAIAVVMWAFRMMHLDNFSPQERAEYSDVMERALYNGVLSGLALSGEEYFYVNPLQNDGSHRRQKWFGCACCPPNLARLVAQLPGYFYSTGKSAERDEIWVHLFAAGEADIEMQSGARAKFTIETRYPYEEEVRLTLQNGGDYTLHVRVPAWCENAKISVVRDREKIAEYSAQAGSYIALSENWKNGDAIEVLFPMLVRAVQSHPRVLENNGRVAIMRGPILYCAETCDNPDFDLRDILVETQLLQPETMAEGALRGITVLRGTAQLLDLENAPLYQNASTQEEGGRTVAFTMVPYYAWANREAGTMQVWMRTRC